MSYIILATAIIAGLLQGLTGFGAGIVLMLVLPSFFPILKSSAITGVIGLILCVGMIVRFRHYIKIKELILPTLVYMIASSTALMIGKTVDSQFLQKIFGGFLVMLACYYLFFDKNEKKPLNNAVKIIFIILSGMCDGLFGIGGPLMVVYFLNQTRTQEEYLAQIQTFFFVNALYLTILRTSQGLLVTSDALPILFGGIGIVIGSQFGVRLISKINGNIVRKLTYLVIGISGLINIF